MTAVDARTTALAEQLAAFAGDLTIATMPAEVIASVRTRVLDTLGLSLAATEVPVASTVRAYAEHQGGRPDATAIGSAVRLPATQAAFVNGVLAHCLDFDDTHLPSILHPSASVVPAAMATAEARGKSGAELVVAIAAGLEVCVRLGMAGYDVEAGNSVYFEHGQHATSICGAIGSAVAAASLMGATQDQVLSAIGISASMASGIIEANRTGGTVKQVHCGWAAHAGVTAGELAVRGVTGPPTVLEGRFGLFEAFLREDVDLNAVTHGLGQSWDLFDINVKPYPANYFTHTGIDAALRVREAGVRPEDIASIRLGVAGPTVRTIGEPIEAKRRPQTGYQGRFSGPYTLVAALFGGGGLGLGLDDFTDELVQHPQRRALMDRVDVVADPRCADGYPQNLPATLEVQLLDGSRLEEWVAHNRGGRDRPLSASELEAKFRTTAERSLDAADIEAVIDVIQRLDEIEHLGPLTNTLAGACG